ncbi:MAG: hypothetical protein IKW79_03355, partial [Schwartzia sp.]|nr:hypothetical protein [Schwartzia sp. (in: firmicutes)]
YSLDVEDPVIEWEITAHSTKDGTFVVGQVVLRKDCQTALSEIVESLCNKYHLDAIKFYEQFDDSDVTGKRDVQKLRADKKGYYAPLDDVSLYQLSFSDGKITKRVIDKSAIGSI